MVHWCLEVRGSGDIYWTFDHLSWETEKQKPVYTAFALLCFPGYAYSSFPPPKATRRHGDVSLRTVKPWGGTENIHNDPKVLKSRSLLRGAILFIPPIRVLRRSCSRRNGFWQSVSQRVGKGRISSSLYVQQIMDKKRPYKFSHNHFGVLSVFSWFNLLS